MASFRENQGVVMEDWGMLRMVARCAESMGHGEMDVFQVITRDKPLKDLYKEDKCSETSAKNTI